MSPPPESKNNAEMAYILTPWALAHSTEQPTEWEINKKLPTYPSPVGRKSTLLTDGKIETFKIGEKNGKIATKEEMEQKSVKFH